MTSNITGLDTQSKSGKIYCNLIQDVTFTKPSEFIQQVFVEAYPRQYPNNPSLNGRIFEFCVMECLIEKGIVPFYYQVSLEFIPNIDYDIVCFHSTAPVVLSCKTSLRERWKQADLEGMAIRNVYKRASTQLITVSIKERDNLQKKIDSGKVNGLDGCVLAQRPEFDNLLDTLSEREFMVAEDIKPIQRGVVCLHK